jgi:DNA processing protein
MVDPDILRARAGLTQVVEPADSLAVLAVEAWGPLRLTEIICGSTPSQQDWIALKALDREDAEFMAMLRKKLGESIERWRRRRKFFRPSAALDYSASIGGDFLIPEDERWPDALADLNDSAPLGLWTLGEAEMPAADRVIAIVGSREATRYGNSATSMLVRKARNMGLTVISGGAYGIDAQAHREALVNQGSGLPTVAVLAGGLDRLYPAGNVDLLRQIAVDGLLITEMPPGMRPNRYRFLNRNRLIAALSAATIVVEARYRSGALSTANHAHHLNRSVGAVPGPIDVPSSAGCHRLIKETPTLLINHPSDLEALYEGTNASSTLAHEMANQRDYDILDVDEMLVFEALPLHAETHVGQLSERTGLSVPRITGILAMLDREGLAEKRTEGWRKRRNTPR